jgi:hypothetical protein
MGAVKDVFRKMSSSGIQRALSVADAHLKAAQQSDLDIY